MQRYTFPYNGPCAMIPLSEKRKKKKKECDAAPTATFSL